MHRPRLLICVSAMLLSGCAVHQLQDDQDRMRTALLGLYTNQVMDNLVRAVNGLPIIQLDYTNANSQLTVDANATLGDALATTHANTLAAIGLQSALVMRALGNTLSGGASVTQTNLVGVSAAPMITNDEVYDAYLRFLAEPGTLQISGHRPPEGAAHLCVRCGKEYYWVPIEYRDLFFKLSAIATAQRGQTLLPPEPFYRARLVGFAEPVTPKQLIDQLDSTTRLNALSADEKKELQMIPLEKLKTVLETEYGVNPEDIVKITGGQFKSGRFAGQCVLHLKLDRLIPADLGKLELADGTRIDFSFFAPDLKIIEYKTRLITIFLDPKKAPLGITCSDGFRFPMPVRVWIDSNPNHQQPTTRELLERLPFRTPQISLDVPEEGLQAAPEAESLPAPQPAPDGRRSGPAPREWTARPLVLPEVLPVSTRPAVTFGQPREVP